MAFAIFYNFIDSQAIQDAVLATSTRNRLSNADRQNLDAVWNAGVNTWNTTADRAYNPETGTWHQACYRNGVLDTGLCDEDTRIIVVNGVWSSNSQPYAIRNQAITKVGMSALIHRLADAHSGTSAAETVQIQAQYLHTLADDIAMTAREPYP